MPPMMMMMKALTTGSAPIAGLTANSGASSPPAPPASAHPIPKPSAENQLDVDALERRRVGVLRHRAHRAARPAPAQEQVERAIRTTAESETTSRSTEITSPKAAQMPEKAEGTGLSRTPKESWAEACMTQRSRATR